MKKIALIMALVMLVLSIAACSQEKNDLPKNDSVNSEPTSTQESTDSTETEGTTAATIKICEHAFTETVLQDATCEEEGIRLLTCSLCGEERSSGIPVLGHKGSGASCTEPSFCILCGMLDEPAWGHDDQNGYCRNCGIDMAEVTAPTPAPAPTVDSTEPTQ